MPNRIPLRKIKRQRIYPSLGKKTIARVALLTGCVQRVISPEINESTIRLLNRHECRSCSFTGNRLLWFIEPSFGKKDLAHSSFKNNIELWHEEYLKNGLDAIISNTSGCGTTLKDYGFIFRDDKDLKKKVKKFLKLQKILQNF